MYACEEDIIKINRLGIQTIRGNFVVETEYGAITINSEKSVKNNFEYFDKKEYKNHIF